MTNEQLLAYAARNPPPIDWCETPIPESMKGPLRVILPAELAEAANWSMSSVIDGEVLHVDNPFWADEPIIVKESV